MNQIVITRDTVHALPTLVDRAAQALMGARNSAEVLEARDLAGFAYDTAKRTARLAKAKAAHDDLIGAAHRAQAHALEIEAQAKHRLADEYDAAQERGEVATRSDQNLLPDEKKVSVADLGLSHKDIYEARQIRDAERADPGIIRRTLDQQLAARQEPTKAEMRRVISDAAMRAMRGAPKPANRNPNYRPPSPYRSAIVAIVGGCSEMVEGAGDSSPFDLIDAFVDGAERARGIADIRRCRDFLTMILDAANGH